MQPEGGSPLRTVLTVTASQGKVSQAMWALRKASSWATAQGVPLEKAAKEHEELRIALEEWVDPFKGLEM
jgi:hypothetical protein